LSAKIVLFEDNPDIREFVSMVLREEGYEVVVPESLTEALEHIELHGADLFLLDSEGDDPQAAIDSLRLGCERAGPRVTTVVFTAYTVSKEQALEMGCAGVIPKPFDLDSLLSQIQRYLQLSRGQEAASSQE